ncbi:MAG: hypothetical protein ACTSV2_00245 [Candidatus Thorarchaeota archaeon]
MGLLDSWRRKKQKRPATTRRIVPKAVDAASDTEMNIPALLAEYEKLFHRREELQIERMALTKQLDDGDVTALQFRKELKKRIQEASDISDQLKGTAGHLISLGYTGTLQ